MIKPKYNKNPKAEIINNTIYWNMNQQPSSRYSKGPYPLDENGNSTVPQIYKIDGKTLRNFISIPQPGQSLQDIRPEVAAEFICLDNERDFYEKHKTAYLKPKDIKWGTEQYAWFKCSNPNCQYIWKATISSRTARKIIRDDNDNIIKYVNIGNKCPLCYNNRNESIYEKYLYQLLQPELTKRGFTLEKHVFLSKFDNSYDNGNKDYSKQLMNFDLYIPQSRIFLDFNGYIHNQIDVKKRDNEKKTWAYNHGFNLIVISCEVKDKEKPVSIEKSSHYIKYKIHQQRPHTLANGCSGIVKKTRDEITWVAEQILKEIGSTCRPLYYDRVNNKYRVDSNMNKYCNNQVVNKPIIFDKATGKFKLRNDLR